MFGSSSKFITNNFINKETEKSDKKEENKNNVIYKNNIIIVDEF